MPAAATSFLRVRAGTFVIRYIVALFFLLHSIVIELFNNHTQYHHKSTQSAQTIIALMFVPRTKFHSTQAVRLFVSSSVRQIRGYYYPQQRSLTVATYLSARKRQRHTPPHHQPTPPPHPSTACD